MAKKLVFTINQKFTKGLTFSSHYGSQIRVQPGDTEFLPVKQDDESTDHQLVAFYETRYKQFGLDTKLLGGKLKPKTKTKTEKVKVETPEVVDETPEVVDETPEVVDETPEVVDETPEVVDEEKVLDQEPNVVITETTFNPEEATMPELRDFIKENNIEVKGKSKENLIDACKEFIEK